MYANKLPGRSSGRSSIGCGVLVPALAAPLLPVRGRGHRLRLRLRRDPGRRCIC
jgi:hypothetical protein